MAPLALVPRGLPPPPPSPALLAVWIYFNLFGNTLLLPLLVATFLFSARARRHPALVNVCVTWILSGVFSLLLFYAGQAAGPEPQKALCIAQTTLLYGITPMWSVAVLVLLYNMLRVAERVPVGRARMLVMLSAPYITQLAFSCAALALSVAHPADVSRPRGGLYCALHRPALAFAMSLTTALTGLSGGVLMVRLALRLHRTRDDFNAPLLLRVLVFSAYLVLGFAVNIISMVDAHSRVPDVYAATIGTVLFLVFGTQADVLRTWCFWRGAPPRAPSPVEASWRYSLDLTKSVVPPPEDAGPDDKRRREREREREWEELEAAGRSIAWGEVRAPPPARVHDAPPV
ncbi:hypothetical protein B0H17DRAFT_179209 [Mycena rosella]|uniref:Uncharacterized protein n=1 Tax=Mycena rosella TaxID=1033263 RepID=A0AAD7D0E6_MYCRO|nr:hypothetical protein B0H17DRAFT_179209 [Mycena rosella]